MSRTQLRLRQRARVAQALLLVILVGGTVYVADIVVGGGLFRDPYEVRVHLPEAAGLHEKSTVNYRGQRIGAVTDVGLDDEGVVATIAIDEGVKVPRDSDFLVRNLSAVGEQYLDIRPRTDSGPWLEEGTTIAASETSVPLPIHTVIADTQDLLARIDVRDLRTIAREAELAFGDGSADLRATTVELERTFALLQELEPDLTSLVVDGQVPLRTGVDKEGELRRFARDLALVSEELRRADPTIRRLIDDGSTLLPLVSDLWRGAAPVLSDLLGVMSPLMELSRAHLPGLHVWLDWVPRQVLAMAGSTRDGTGHVLLVPKVLKNCIYTDDQRDPSDLEDAPLGLHRRCTTEAPGIQARGSQNVPTP
jgi:phospholipid/cholesterol/gamma-HCH transport system substrate-binding protein